MAKSPEYESPLETWRRCQVSSWAIVDRTWGMRPVRLMPLLKHASFLDLVAGDLEPDATCPIYVYHITAERDPSRPGYAVTITCEGEAIDRAYRSYWEQET